MESIKIAVRVPLAAAVAAGRSNYGETVVVLTDSDVASLSDGARRLLYTSDRSDQRGLVFVSTSHDCIGQPSRWNHPGPLDLTEATVDAVIAEMERIAREPAKREAEAASKRAASVASAIAAPADDWIGERASSERAWFSTDCAGAELSRGRSGWGHARPKVDTSPRGIYLDDIAKASPEIAAHRATIERTVLPAKVAAWEVRYAEWCAFVEQAKREEEEQAARAVAGQRALVAERGTSDQLERFDAEVLPEDELIELARAAWIPPSDRPVYTKLTRGDADHDGDDCEPPHISFAAEPHDGPWSSGEWAQIKAMRAQYGSIEGCTVTPIRHVATCDRCDAKTVRFGVRVRVERFGLRAQVEYAMGDA